MLNRVADNVACHNQGAPAATMLCPPMGREPMINTMHAGNIRLTPLWRVAGKGAPLRGVFGEAPKREKRQKP
jgi:hypothetical protein